MAIWHLTLTWHLYKCGNMAISNHFLNHLKQVEEKNSVTTKSDYERISDSLSISIFIILKISYVFGNVDF